MTGYSASILIHTISDSIDPSAKISEHWYVITIKTFKKLELTVCGCLCKEHQVLFVQLGKIDVFYLFLEGGLLDKLYEVGSFIDTLDRYCVCDCKESSKHLCVHCSLLCREFKFD